MKPIFHGADIRARSAPTSAAPTPAMADIKAQFTRWLYSGEYRRLRRFAQLRTSNYWDKRHAKWDGSAGRPSIWHQINDFVLANRLMPQLHIREKFRLCSRTPIAPDHLLYADNTRELVAQFQEEISKVQMRLNLAQYYDKSCMGGEHEDEFESEMSFQGNPFPLYQYCRAVRQNDEISKKAHRENAMRELFQHFEAHVNVWGDMLPRGFAIEVLARNYGQPQRPDLIAPCVK